MSENFVLGLLQASVTLAGLILAIYALIIPISRKMFEQKALELFESVKEFRAKAIDVETVLSSGEATKLKKKLEKIEEKLGLPAYLSWGIGFCFFAYVVCIFLSVWWLADWNRVSVEPWLGLVFQASTSIFLLVGLSSIIDIYRTMKRQFEELKKPT